MRNLSLLATTTLLASVAIAQPQLRLKTLKETLSDEARGRARTELHRTRTPGRSHLLIQFADGSLDDQVNEVVRRGATVLSYVPDSAVFVVANDDIDLAELKVRSVGRLGKHQKISPQLDLQVGAVVEFYPDVDPADARAIVTQQGLVIREHPDALRNHLVVQGAREQIEALASWDEVAYIFPASRELIQGRAVRGCIGALTRQGIIGQAVALINDGWDGPGLGSADLGYAFVHLTERLPADAVQSEIVRAFGEWAKYAALNFIPTSNPLSDRTIAVLFASGAHGDLYPFDGHGGVLAHTFYPLPSNSEPLSGDMHFDNDESWNIGYDVDLFSIALHEAGHALGLGHSDTPGDVMYPYYIKHTALTTNDIGAIQSLYAARAGGIDPNPISPPTQVPLTLTVQAPQSATAAASIAISGTFSGGTGPVQISWSTNQGLTGTLPGSSPWTIASIPLSLGLNVINIQAIDSQQTKASQNVIVTRQQVSAPNPNPSPAPAPPSSDTTPPSLIVLSPASNNISTSASSVVFSGTAADNVGVAKVTWSTSTGGSGIATGTAQWTTAPIPIYIGTTTVTVRAYDAAGNSGWRSITVTRR